MTSVADNLLENKEADLGFSSRAFPEHFVADDHPSFGIVFRYRDIEYTHPQGNRSSPGSRTPNHIRYPVYIVLSRDSITAYFHGPWPNKAVREPYHRRLFSFPLEAVNTSNDAIAQLMRSMLSTGVWPDSGDRASGGGADAGPPPEENVGSVKICEPWGYASLDRWARDQVPLGDGDSPRLARLLLDLLFDLLHGDVFLASPHAAVLERRIRATPPLNALLTKSEYYWLREQMVLANDSDQKPALMRVTSQGVKASRREVQELFEAEHQWRNACIADQPETLNQSGNRWFRDAEDEMQSLVFWGGSKSDNPTWAETQSTQQRIYEMLGGREASLKGPWDNARHANVQWFLQQYDLESALAALTSRACLGFKLFRGPVYRWLKIKNPNPLCDAPTLLMAAALILLVLCLCWIVDYKGFFGANTPSISLWSHFWYAAPPLVLWAASLLGVSRRLRKEQKETQEIHAPPNNPTCPAWSKPLLPWITGETSQDGYSKRIPFVALRNTLIMLGVLLLVALLLADLGFFANSAVQQIMVGSIKPLSSLIPREWPPGMHRVLILTAVPLFALVFLRKLAKARFDAICDFISRVFELGRSAARVLLPRLLFALTGAWVLISSSEEIIKSTLLASGTTIVLLSSLLLIVAWFFTMLRVYSRVEDMFIATRRSIIVVALAFFVSLGIGLSATSAFVVPMLVNSGFLGSPEFRAGAPEFHPYQTLSRHPIPIEPSSALTNEISPGRVIVDPSINCESSYRLKTDLPKMSWGIRGAPLANFNESNGISLLYIIPIGPFSFYIAPGMLLLQSSFVVFAGLFLQLIFDEKPMTEPL